DEVAHADELAAALAQPLDVACGGIRIGERQPADHAAHVVDLLADIEAFLRLAADLVQYLDQDGALDAAARELRAQIIGREVAVEAVADQLRPRIGVPSRPPEMMMRIDHGSIYQIDHDRGATIWPSCG